MVRWPAATTGSLTAGETPVISLFDKDFSMRNFFRQFRERIASLYANLIVLSCICYAQTASAAGELDKTDGFNQLYNQLTSWAHGSLGKSIALVFLLVGLATGVARGNIFAAVVTIAAGLCLVVAPSVIDSIFAGA